MRLAEGLNHCPRDIYRRRPLEGKSASTDSGKKTGRLRASISGSVMLIISWG